MGIARAMIKLLMREAKREKFAGKVLTAGRQDVYATAKNLNKWAKEMDFTLKPGVEMEITKNELFRKKGYISDNALFLSLGFDTVESIDYSSYQQCTILHDLNKDVSEEYHNKYDLVFDGGTAEHIFNVPKVFENFSRMTKVGGRMIHASPSSNYVDHGLYQFSPTFFVDYYSANKWDIIETLFVEVKSNHRWNLYIYSPGSLDTWLYGGYCGLFGTYSVTKKTSSTIIDGTVYQGLVRGTRLSDSMSRRDDPIAPEIKELLDKKTIIHRLGYRVSKRFLTPQLRDSIRPVYLKIASKLPLRFHLRLIARY